MLVTSAFMRDRAMSLHRRAFELRERGESLDKWITLARRLDCPDDTIWQIWRTAGAAIDADMTKEKAFPLTGEMKNS